MYNSIALLLGHLVGDYFFQSDKMALEKSQRGDLGKYYCRLHCFIYSLCVALFVVVDGWRSYMVEGSVLSKFFLNLFVAFIIAYITHYPIDRTSFAWKWMKKFKSIQFQDTDGYAVMGHDDKGNPTGIPDIRINKRQYFVAPVYIAVDNTMHLVLMWMLFSLLGK